jgi:hypothetical protein
MIVLALFAGVLVLICCVLTWKLKRTERRLKAEQDALKRARRDLRLYSDFCIEPHSRLLEELSTLDGPISLAGVLSWMLNSMPGDSIPGYDDGEF